MRTPSTSKLRKKKNRRNKWLSSAARGTRDQDEQNDLSDVRDSSSTSSNSTNTSEYYGEDPVKLSSSTYLEKNNNCTKERTPSVLALDCEMVGVGEGKRSALARCSIVNYDGKVIYDKYVKPEGNITDFRTQWSGVRPKHMNKAISFSKARKQAKRLTKNHTLVGHSLRCDLHALKLSHPYNHIRDTSEYVPLRVLAGLSRNIMPSLKQLTKILLKSEIQVNEHCSVEDATSSLNLYKLCENQWERENGDEKNRLYLCDAYWPSWTNLNKI